MHNDPQIFHENLSNLRDVYSAITGKKEEGIVRDFGDFHPYYQDKLLKQYKFTESGITKISDDVIIILSLTKSWLEYTGNKFILDPKKFRGTIQKKPDID